MCLHVVRSNVVKPAVEGEKGGWTVVFVPRLCKYPDISSIIRAMFAAFDPQDIFSNGGDFLIIPGTWSEVVVEKAVQRVVPELVVADVVYQTRPEDLPFEIVGGEIVTLYKI